MTTIYYEDDGDVGALAGQTVAVVGYGNQGRSWALNLRDSGCKPVVCVRRDDTREQAEADGFEAHDVEGANDADVICILVPDDVIAAAPALAPRRLLRDRRERLHARVRPARSARRRGHGRTAHARPRSSELLRRRGRLHHCGRRASRRDRPRAGTRARRRPRDRRIAAGRDRADRDARGGARPRRRAGPVAGADGSQHGLRADDGGARHTRSKRS